MKILVAPDKFKGSLTALEAAKALAAGLVKAFPGAEIDLAPIADGGEGFAEAVAPQSRQITLAACDALRRPITAHYRANDELAVIEMSECSGMSRLKREELQPLHANTFGTGQLIADAARNGAKTIVVGLGGSATTDAGAGMAEALGLRFLSSKGIPLAGTPMNFGLIECINTENYKELPPVIAACDVTNPLLGTNGTARIYAPQKGATPEQVEMLEAKLAHLANVVKRELGCDFRDIPGSGAAGGLGFGLLSFCNARIRSGFEIVCEALDLGARIIASDLVVTGEGQLDSQSAQGKGPVGIAALARKHGKRIEAFVGNLAAPPEVCELFDAIHPINTAGLPVADSMRQAAQLLEQAAAACS